MLGEESDDKRMTSKEIVFITLLNIFNRLKSLSYLKTNIATFIIINKSEYNLILDNSWLIGLGYNIDKQNARYWKNNKEKRLYYIKNSIQYVLSSLLYIFYKLLFPDFITINSNGKVIITKFFKYYMVMDNLDLSEYYDLEYIKIESKYLSFKDKNENEKVTYINNIFPLMIMDTADISNNFIITFSDFLKQDSNINNNFIFAFFNQELIQFSME